MKRVTDLANGLAQPMYLMMAVFGISAVFVVIQLVRWTSVLATDWRRGESWHTDVSHVIVSFTALALLSGAIVGVWKKARG